MYADVFKNMNFKQVDQLDMFKNNLASYYDFKIGFSSEKTMNDEITGKYPKAKT
jgi:hypothetical protein